MKKMLSNPKNVNTADPAGTFSQGVRVGNRIQLAGQVAKDANGNIVGKGDARAQAKQIFENIRLVLEDLGATMDDVTRRMIFLKNGDDLKAVYDVMADYFPNPDTYPACACVTVAGLADPDYLLEIVIDAVVPE